MSEREMVFEGTAKIISPFNSKSAFIQRILKANDPKRWSVTDEFSTRGSAIEQSLSFAPMSLKKSVLRGMRRRFGFGRLSFALSYGPALRSVRQELGELPEVLGGGCEVELVSGAIGAA